MEATRTLLLVIALAATSCAILNDPEGVELRDGAPDMSRLDSAQQDTSPTADSAVADTATPDMSAPGDVSLCPEADLMNDPANCGACGVHCFSVCDEGYCDARVVAHGQDLPFGIESDGNHVYWANEDPGAVWRAAVDGGEPELLATGNEGPNQVNPRFLHLTTTDVIVSVVNSGTLNHGLPLFRVPKGGGIATGFSAPIADGTEDFVIVGSTVYSAFPRSDLINVAPLGQGSVTPLTDTPAASSVAHFEGRLYFVGSQGLGRIEVTGGPSTMLHEAEITSASQVRSDGERIYIAAGSTIYALDPTDDSLDTLTDGLFGVRSLAVFEDRLFFLSGVGSDTGSAFSIDKETGGDLIERISGIERPHLIAVDDDQIYCTAKGLNPGPGTGYILRADRR